MVSALFKSAKPILNYCVQMTQRLLPGLCILCGARADAANLCTDCRHDLPYLPAERCPHCAAPSRAAMTCGSCLARPPAFDGTAAACAYAYPIDRIIQSFKYAADLSVAPLLADLLAREIGTHARPDLIVPMPLSDERLRERGFNQALELAGALADRLGIPLAPDACRRVRHGPPQSALAWEERARNIAGAFVCMEDMAGRSVAVVDDVLTTGATLNEIARVLRKRGASTVVGWVAARTLERA